MFREPNTQACVLCGSTEKLTGEHKVKASVLRREFGQAKLVIRTDPEGARDRLAQSTKSDAFKFRSRLCEPCNTARTQVADRAFEALHARVSELYQQKRDLDEIRSEDVMAEGSDNYLNTFRYFSKLFACRLADIGAPTQNELCEFALGKIDFNPINFFVKLDHSYAVTAAELGDLQSAALGSLLIFGNEDTHFPTAFYSTFSVGPIQYCFSARLNAFGQVRLRLLEPEFFFWCRDIVAQGAANPMPDHDRLSFGLEK